MLASFRAATGLSKFTVTMLAFVLFKLEIQCFCRPVSGVIIIDIFVFHYTCFCSSLVEDIALGNVFQALAEEFTMVLAEFGQIKQQSLR